MCGIVGLLVKRPELREKLGALMVPMLIGMTERGPDSSGMAVFTEPVDPRHRKLSLYCADPQFDWKGLGDALKGRYVEVTLEIKANHAILRTASDPADVRTWLLDTYPGLHVLSVGRQIDLYKYVGLPAAVAERY